MKQKVKKQLGWFGLRGSFGFLNALRRCVCARLWERVHVLTRNVSIYIYMYMYVYEMGGVHKQLRAAVKLSIGSFHIYKYYF